MWYDYRRGPLNDWKYIQPKHNWTDVDFVGCSVRSIEVTNLREALNKIEEDSLK